MDIRQAESMALELMAKFGLRDWTKGHAWAFKWDHARRRFGCCRYHTKTITLSRHLVALNAEEQVRDTILHEIAHALAGPQARHGILWRVQCHVTGARPVACYSTADVIQPRGLWRGVCPSCGHVRQAYKRMKRKYACGACCSKHAFGRFDARFAYTWTQNEVTA